ncbi:uncharacterized protein [Argopecten irradians]|uniref:uncharacterized protein n=1 Tax=Argopecten irradians TaxID=31199 RepID=UPI0037195AE1
MSSIPTCPRDDNQRLVCSRHASTTCMSLHYGLHQDCVMADGWLTCLDVTMTNNNRKVCSENYGVHNNSVWVQDGCEASFEACYVTDVSGSRLRQRTLECRNLDDTYKMCEVEGAKLVKDVELKYELPSHGPCSKGISYGIFNNSMWIHSGCNGIFDIQYYEAKSSSPGVTLAPTPTPKPVPPTTPAPTPAPTPKQTTPYVKYPFDPETPRPPYRPTPTPGLSSTTQGAGATPFQGRDNLVPITVAVFMGIFVALLLIMFAVLWICRRNTVVKRHLGDPGTNEKTTRESDELSNAYEEIAPVLELSRYEKSREDDPFLAAKSNNLNMEHNNNPPLPPNNYFILEPHTPDPPTPRGSTISSSSHGYYKVDPGAPPLMAPPLSVPTQAGIPPYYGAPPLPDPNVQPYAQTMLQLDHMSKPFVRNIPTAPIRTDEQCSIQFSPGETKFVNYNTNPSTFTPIPQYPSLHRHSSRTSTDSGYEKIEDHWGDPRRSSSSGTPDRLGHSSTPDRLSHSSDRHSHSTTPDRLSHSSTLERHCHSSTPDRLLLGDSRHKQMPGSYTSFDNHTHC